MAVPISFYAKQQQTQKQPNSPPTYPDSNVRCRISTSSTSFSSTEEDASSNRREKPTPPPQYSGGINSAERSSSFVISIASGDARESSHDSADDEDVDVEGTVETVTGITSSFYDGSDTDVDEEKTTKPPNVIFDSEVPMPEPRSPTPSLQTEHRPEFSPSGRILPPPPIILHDGKVRRSILKKGKSDSAAKKTSTPNQVRIDANPILSTIPALPSSPVSSFSTSAISAFSSMPMPRSSPAPVGPFYQPPVGPGFSQLPMPLPMTTQQQQQHMMQQQQTTQFLMQQQHVPQPTPALSMSFSMASYAQMPSLTPQLQQQYPATRAAGTFPGFYAAPRMGMTPLSQTTSLYSPAMAPHAPTYGVAGANSMIRPPLGRAVPQFLSSNFF